MNLYLDTNLWNVLCDQEIEPNKLLSSLASENSNLVLSFQTIYELAKNFHAPGEQVSRRGIELFTYLKHYVEADIPCVKLTEELLAAEMSALQFGTNSIDAYISESDYGRFKSEIEKLAAGVFDERVNSFIESRIAFASYTRFGQSRHLEGRPDVKQKLKGVPNHRLDEWLEAQTISLVGQAMLASRIIRVFPEAPTEDANEYAKALLHSQYNRVARGLVRADLYYNWRCANRDSNPKDLMDDMLHVLTSAYCDVYATQEKRQAEYASLLLTSHTSVAIYDDESPADQWLEELAAAPVNGKPC